MDNLLRVVGWIAAFYFLVTPLLIFFTHRAPLRPQINVGEHWPPYPIADAVQLLGFQPVAYLYLPQAVTNTEALLWLLVHPTEQDKALVTMIRNKIKTEAGVQEKTMAYLEYSTRFATGETFDTMNSQALGSFPPAPKVTRTQVPSVADPARLYAIHRWRMREERVMGTKIVWPEATAAEYLDRVLREGYERQVTRGIFRRDEKAGVYKTTLLGAYRLTWQELFPFKQWRTYQMQQQEKHILARFDGQANRVISA